MAEGRVRGFSVATKCATVDELIEKFRDRVDETSILVNPVEQRDVGTECAFAILLSDRKVGLAGTCVVLEVYKDGNNPFKRPGMRLGIKRLGPESQKVFAELIAKRIEPRKMTMMMPAITTAPAPAAPAPALIQASQKPAAPAPMQASQKPVLVMPRSRRVDARESPGMQVITEAPKKRLPTVQPSATEREEPLARPPRATPFDLDNVVRVEPAPIFEEVTAVPPEPQAALRQLKSETPKPAPRRVETRTPHSPFILPANPLASVTDASLEGLVDCRLFDDMSTPAPGFPTGTVDNEEPVRETTKPEPLPLPPPPAAPPAPAAAPTQPLPYAKTRLPDLNTGANDKVRLPLLKSSVRNRLLLAIGLVPLLGAAGVVLFMRMHDAPPAAPTITPPSASPIDEPVTTRAAVEPAPAQIGNAAVVETTPDVRQPIHAVLIKTYPIAAKVTVGGRYFGTTPTYVKIPANTPVQIKMERAGFKSVMYPLTSRKVGDRVFVRLQRRGGRR